MCSTSRVTTKGGYTPPRGGIAPHGQNGGVNGGYLPPYKLAVNNNAQIWLILKLKWSELSLKRQCSSTYPTTTFLRSQYGTDVWVISLNIDLFTKSLIKYPNLKLIYQKMFVKYKDTPSKKQSLPHYSSAVKSSPCAEKSLIGTK